MRALVLALAVPLAAPCLMGCTLLKGSPAATPEWKAVTSREYSMPTTAVFPAVRSMCTDRLLSIKRDDAGQGLLVTEWHRSDILLSGTTVYEFRTTPTQAGTLVSLLIYRKVGYRTRRLVREAGEYDDLFLALDKKLD